MLTATVPVPSASDGPYGSAKYLYLNVPVKKYFIRLRRRYRLRAETLQRAGAGLLVGVHAEIFY